MRLIILKKCFSNHEKYTLCKWKSQNIKHDHIIKYQVSKKGENVRILQRLNMITTCCFYLFYFASQKVENANLKIALIFMHQ